jgi:hypothetical protein
VLSMSRTLGRIRMDKSTVKHFWGMPLTGVGSFESPKAYAIQRATLAGCGREAHGPVFSTQACFACMQAKKPRRAYHFADAKCSKLHFTNKVLSQTIIERKFLGGVLA